LFFSFGLCPGLGRSPKIIHGLDGRPKAFRTSDGRAVPTRPPTWVVPKYGVRRLVGALCLPQNKAVTSHRTPKLGQDSYLMALDLSSIGADLTNCDNLPSPQ